MSWPSKIFNAAKGKKFGLKITDQNAALVTDTRTPPVANSTERIFRQFFTDDGTPSGSSDMLVDGSTDNVEFFIPAVSGADRYIREISWVIADQNAALNTFGAISALTNGVEVTYEDPSFGNVTIHEGIKSNFDLVRLCGTGAPPVGSTTSAFRANNVVGNSEGYIAVLDFVTQFGLPWGVKIPADSTLKLVIKIRDNITAIDGFNAIAYGFDRII